MQAQYNGYSPSTSSLEYVQAQIFASFAADLAQLCSEGATELFRTYATTLVGIPYEPGVAAQAVISITAQTVTGTIATTNQALASGGTIVEIPVVALQYGIAAGPLTLTDPTGLLTQTFTTSGALAGATTVPVTSAILADTFGVGSTLTGTQAYSLGALSQFTLDSYGFINLAPATINSGTSSQITLTAVQSGAIFNGAGQGGSIQSVQQLTWVTTLSLVSVASGGQDPEDDTDYLNRVTGQLQLQAPRPITASDYGTMALSFAPYSGTDQQEVGRATAVDGYNPADQTYNNERMVTVAVADSNGYSLNSDTLYGYPLGSASNVIATVPNPNSGWGVAGWLESLREVNFIVNVISPTYSQIYVSVTVTASSGWDATSVASNVQAALLSFLSPGSWGLPPSSIIGWENTTTIYQSALMSVVQNSAGVAYVHDGTLAFGLALTPSNTADLVLPGPVALPLSSIASIPTTAITVLT